jgi:hypothetical protein
MQTINSKDSSLYEYIMISLKINSPKPVSNRKADSWTEQLPKHFYVLKDKSKYSITTINQHLDHKG